MGPGPVGAVTAHVEQSEGCCGVGHVAEQRGEELFVFLV
jgi:hypothetical protein